MVIVGIISSITIGLSNTAYKQMILSSVARDSATAFYQSDIAVECALYADREYGVKDIPTNPWNCGGYSLLFTTSGTTPTIKYSLNPISSVDTSNSKCFRIVVTKTETEIAIVTKIDARGYNICDKTNLRTVERAIEVNY